MQSLGEIVPLLSLASRAERAALRAERAMVVRQGLHGQKAHLELDDGLALTPDALERLTRCHRATYLAVDWTELAERDEVEPPARSHEREQKARRLLASYEPSWQERVFAEEAQRRRELTERVQAATHADALEHRQAVELATAHNAEVAKARRMLAFDHETLQDAVAESGLTALRESLNSLGLARPQPDRVVAVLDVIQEQDIPPERITSRNPHDARRELIPDMDRRKLHLTAVSATVLRVAGELVGLLPVERLEVVAECEPSLFEEDPSRPAILQLRIDRKTVERMSWASDPTSLLRSLSPRMDWKLDRGFRPISLAGSEPELAQSA